MKLLFISHDDTRTGAPILLLNLHNAIKKNHPTVEIHFLIKNYTGQIFDSFKSVATTYSLFNNEVPSIIKKIFRKVFKINLLSKVDQKLQEIDIKSFDLILSNTITNGDILPIIRKYFSGPIISYIHELEIASKLFTTNAEIQGVLSCTNFFLTPSNAVKTFIEEAFNIQNNQIDWLPYYIHLASKEMKHHLKESSVRPDKTTMVVGGCGTIDWRKGIDVFLQIAYYVKQTMPEKDIVFKWKGATEGIDLEKLQYDLEKSGLIASVEIMLAGGEMDKYFEELDVFLLTSREDPFPLVVLESADFCVPTICFDGAGGAQEFVSTDKGTIVPYFSIKDASEAIANYFANSDLRKKHGQNAKKQVKEIYNNHQLISSLFINIVENVIDHKSEKYIK